MSSDFKNINDEKEIIKSFVKKYNINHKFIRINFENKKDILGEYLNFKMNLLTIFLFFINI